MVGSEFDPHYRAFHFYGRRDVGRYKGQAMSVAKVIEISSTSEKSFEDAIAQGIARASKTVDQVRSAWIKEQRVDVENGRVKKYQVNMQVTFVLND